VGTYPRQTCRIRLNCAAKTTVFAYFASLAVTGKTTLVDKLFEKSGTSKVTLTERAMDSNDLEKERGITIFAKNAAVTWKGHKINIIGALEFT
jgi:predicted membrane GTPase involved in stress response